MNHMEDRESMQLAKSRAEMYVWLGWTAAPLEVEEGLPEAVVLLETGVGIC